MTSAQPNGELFAASGRKFIRVPNPGHAVMILADKQCARHKRSGPRAAADFVHTDKRVTETLLSWYHTRRYASCKRMVSYRWTSVEGWNNYPIHPHEADALE